MTHRRAAIPVVTGGLLLTALLWWAGASAHALNLPGAVDVLGSRAAAELQVWLTPWAYDPPARDLTGVTATGGADYLTLYRTGLQIRFAAVFVFFVPGALLLLRRLPPVHGRRTAALLAVWAWGMVAGTLAVTVSAPWLIASYGHGSYRVLPQLASLITTGREATAVASLFAAAVTVLVARVTAEDADPLPQAVVPARTGRLAATVGTAVIAVSLVVLSYQSVAAAIQTYSPGIGLLSEPGELLRQWLLLGAWTAPVGGMSADWLLARAADVLLLVVVWWLLRRLPVLLTRATFPAMALGAVCATVLGLVASQLLRLALDGSGLQWPPLFLSAGLVVGTPAALTFGLTAGVAAAAVLRIAERHATKGV
ncbi:hypothetical protein ACFZAU_29965 [Streptomyces sp. NPDC008238]